MKYIGMGAFLFGMGMLSGLILIINISFRRFDLRRRKENFLWGAFIIGMFGGVAVWFLGQY